MKSSFPRPDRTWQPPRRGNLGNIGVIAGTICALIALVLVVRWVAGSRGLDGAIVRGRELLAATSSAADIESALRRWEQETGSVWHERTDELTARLMGSRDVADRLDLILLARVSGADFADRAADWKTWWETQKRLLKGEQPKVAAGERINLKELWSAPVGLTAWFTTILAIDGNVYVASLGGAFHDAADEADGIVRIGGASGQAELFWAPSDRGPRDVIGLVATPERLIAATASGMIYGVGYDGAEQWKAAAGAAVIAPPLAIDLNRDSTGDAVVLTHGGKVVALNGANGKAIWTAAPPRRRGPARADEPVAYAALAGGDLTGSAATDVCVCTADGAMRVLAPNNGSVRWEATPATGLLSGAIVAPVGDGATALFAGDEDARVLSVLRSNRKLDALPTWLPPAGPGMSILAGVRTLTQPAGARPAVIAAATGSFETRPGWLAALTTDGVAWRVPTRGLIWATPAIADLSGDGIAEIIVPVIEQDAAGSEAGVLLIVAGDGRLLRRLSLDAPVECSPAVADVDGDGKLELLLADRAGWLHCLASGKAGPVEWGCLGGDSHNTNNAANAYSFGQTFYGYQRRWRPK